MRVTDLNILILGHGEHGKSTATDYLCAEQGMTVGESSFVCRAVVYERIQQLASQGQSDLNYADAQQCWADRRNHRALWKHIINEYNHPELDRLARLIYTENNIYTGLRNEHEFMYAYDNGVFDLIVFVDAVDRLGIKEKTDLTINTDVAHIRIDNNGTVDAMMEQLKELSMQITHYRYLRKRHSKQVALDWVFGRQFAAQRLRVQSPSYTQWAAQVRKGTEE